MSPIPSNLLGFMRLGIFFGEADNDSVYSLLFIIFGHYEFSTIPYRYQMEALSSYISFI